MRLLYGGLLLCVVLGLSAATYLLGFQRATAQAAGFTVSNTRLLSRTLVRIESEDIRSSISDAVVGNFLYLLSLRTDLDKLDASNAASLCVISKHRVEILQNLTQDDFTRKTLNDYLEAIEKPLEQRMSVTTSIGNINPCSQPL